MLTVAGCAEKSEIWTSKTALKTDDGILIPAGTEFVVERHMPEGFTTIKLSLNIEGEFLNKFDKITSEHTNLTLPHYLSDDVSD